MNILGTVAEGGTHPSLMGGVATPSPPPVLVWAPPRPPLRKREGWVPPTDARSRHYVQGFHTVRLNHKNSGRELSRISNKIKKENYSTGTNFVP
jgi:hypothetical protein